MNTRAITAAKTIVKTWRQLASFPGAEGEERERLVHTVCACALSPRNSVATVYVSIRTYTGDVINSAR